MTNATASNNSATTSSLPLTDEENIVAEAAVQSWYWASAKYKAITGDSSKRKHLWQDIVFLFRASSSDDAQGVALSIAKGKEHTYKNHKQDNVQWMFQQVNQIEELFDQSLQDGAEVYWKFYEKVDSRI